MTLIENAGALYLRLKSNQLMLVVGLVCGAQAAFEAWDGRSWFMPAAAAVLSFGATIARIVAQPETIAKVEIDAAVKEAMKAYDARRA